MAVTHNLGFPRIGAKRELKFALESYWQGQLSARELEGVGASLRQRQWQQQDSLDYVPVGDFSLYDHVLDMSVMLGNLPDRVNEFQGDSLDNYFRIARGRSQAGHNGCCGDVMAGEMTKWFDTNYHYIVPEFSAATEFKLDASRLLTQIAEARQLGLTVKPVLIGPLTYLALGKVKDRCDKLALLDPLLIAYRELLQQLAEQGIDWVQMDEPILVTELEPRWGDALLSAYRVLQPDTPNLLLTTYFGQLQGNLPLVTQLPVQGFHLDAIHAKTEVNDLVARLHPDQILSLGVINGRNIWKTDLNAVLDWLEPIAHALGERLWIAPSCSLLHVPVDLDNERAMDAEIKTWLSFATQKLAELKTLALALNEGRAAVREDLAANQQAVQSRRDSPRVHNPAVKAALAKITPQLGQRDSPYPIRSAHQRASLNLPLFPTTTIGSFPQTREIRQLRNRFKTRLIDQSSYQQAIRAEIKHVVEQQEALGLDVLVHGEAERNDMVEYFGEQLEGYVLSQFGWVQSYGSRCVKPPILFGDIHRPLPMTVEWTRYAQSLTQKPMKGMLTGPVTILNWSFVRDDQPRSVSCRQLALAIREEVLDLEKAGIQIIQIDEAALREGLPLRKDEWEQYLQWAVDSFRISANGVNDQTQIHTHMCYSEFNDIIKAIGAMDADVITIETSRSNLELLSAFEHYAYPNDMGPGVYDIHSPTIPKEEDIVQLMTQAAQHIPAERLWINPDCGLKTRQWAEVIPALTAMVHSAKTLRLMASGGCN